MKHTYIRYLSFISLTYLNACSATPPMADIQPLDPPMQIAHLAADCQAKNNLISDACLQQDYLQADANLNRVYKQIVRHSPVGNYIRPPQRAWVDFRDKHCQAWQAKQSHVKPLAAKNHCLTILTNERLYTLQNHILAQRPYPGGDFMSQDKRLNQVYRQYKNSLNAEDKIHLLAAQRAWLVFRDASCPSKQTQCLAYFTRYRISGLQQLYTQKTSLPISPTMPTIVAPISANDEGLSMNLLGIWKQQRPVSDNTLLEFGIRNGIHHYLLRLDQLPFEAGQWQLQGDTLSLVDSDGTERHLYRHVQIQRGFLNMSSTNGEILTYQRVGAN